MKKRSYKITFSLKEGYKPNGRVHSLAFAEKVIKDWMVNAITQKQPIVTGLLQQGVLFFPAKSESKEVITADPTAIFFGELSSPEDMKRKNKEVRQTLESLAGVLKKQLKQVSVFIIYRDDNWCV